LNITSLGCLDEKSGPCFQFKIFSGNYPSVETNIDGKVVPVCQAFEYGKYLGHIDIKFTKENSRYVINQRSDFSVSFDWSFY